MSNKSNIKKKIKLLFSIITFAVSLSYALLYTTIPAVLIINYLNITQNIEINYNNLSGYLLSKNGINIDSISIKHDFAEVNVTKLNIILEKIIDYKINFSINNVSANTEQSKELKIQSLHKDLESRHPTQKQNANNQEIYKLAPDPMTSTTGFYVSYNNISGQYNKTGFYLYHNNKSIVWPELDKTTNKYKTSLSFEINKNLEILDIIPKFYKFKVKANFDNKIINWHIIAFFDDKSLSKTSNRSSKAKQTLDNNIIITGYTELKHYIPKQSKFKLVTNKPILIIKDNYAKIYGNQDIEITVSPNTNQLFNDKKVNLNINGNVYIESGIITPVPSTKIKLSDDIIFINSSNNSCNNGFKQDSKSNLNKNILSNNVNIIANLKIISSNNKLVFKTKDLSTKLKGEIDLYYNNNIYKDPIAQGEIHLINGTYQMYGYPLKIKQGTLLYSNNPLDNPTIKLIGERKVELQYLDRSDIDKNNSENPETKIARINNGIVGLNISGTLNSPDIKLYSSVLMNEADQISYLLFGIPSNKINEAHGQILLQTAKQLFSNDNNEYQEISEQIKNILHIDHISVENKMVINDSTGHYHNQPTLILGKQFFSKLILKFGVSMAKPLSSVTAEYEIRKNLKLTATYDSQNSSSADIVYSKESDRLL